MRSMWLSELSSTTTKMEPFEDIRPVVKVGPKECDGLIVIGIMVVCRDAVSVDISVQVILDMMAIITLSIGKMLRVNLMEEQFLQKHKEDPRDLMMVLKDAKE